MIWIKCLFIDAANINSMIMTFKVCQQKVIKFQSSILLYKPLICIPCCFTNNNLASLKKQNKHTVVRFGLILTNKAFDNHFPSSWYSPDFRYHFQLKATQNMKLFHWDSVKIFLMCFCKISIIVVIYIY